VDSPSSKREALTRRAEFLYLASRDFWDVGLCVDLLLDDAALVAQLPPRVRQTLEAGMLVTYARPFSGRSGRTISSAGNLSQELREFHEDIISRRNRVYAHTDHTDIRQIIDFRADDGLDAVLRDADGSTIFREQWDSLTEKGLTCLRELARIHYGRCRSELDRLRDRLGPRQPD
jgi:hypothetical protein